MEAPSKLRNGSSADGPGCRWTRASRGRGLAGGRGTAVDSTVWRGPGGVSARRGTTSSRIGFVETPCRAAWPIFGGGAADAPAVPRRSAIPTDTALDLAMAVILPRIREEQESLRLLDHPPASRVKP